MPEPVPLRERVIGLMYLIALCLALTVLWELAVTRSTEARITYYPPLMTETQALAWHAGEQ